MGRAFSPSTGVGPFSWGVAPGNGHGAPHAKKKDTDTVAFLDSMCIDNPTLRNILEAKLSALLGQPETVSATQVEVSAEGNFPALRIRMPAVGVDSPIRPTHAAEISDGLVHAFEFCSQDPTFGV